MADERHNAAFMVGILLGALGGALGTLFLTPLAGEQTRAQLRARFTGLGSREAVPAHLDSGTYARGGAMTARAERHEAGADGILSSLRERAQQVTGERGPVATLRSKVQGLTGDAASADTAKSTSVGTTVTFAPTAEARDDAVTSTSRERG